MTSKEHLIDTLLNVLQDISKNENLIIEADNYLLKQHNIQPSMIQELIVNKFKVEEMEEEMLIVVANALFNGAKYHEMKVDQYFDEVKIKKALRYKEERGTSAYPMVFEKALIGSQQDVVVILPIQTIADWYMKNYVVYNDGIQRKPVRRMNKKTGEVTVKKKINKKNIKEIQKMLVDETYLPDTTMTFNVFLDNPDDVIFETYEGDSEDNSDFGMFGRVIINDAIQIAVIDGYHRIEAIMAALEEKPNLKKYLYVSIRFYDEQKAKFYLGQFNSGTPFDKTHTRLLKNYRMEDKITTELVARSELNGHVGKEKSPNPRLGELTTFTILADSINENFDVRNNKDKLEVTESLIRFFDYLIGSEPEAFKGNIEEIAKSSWCNYHNVFPGYVVMAKKLFEKYGRNFPLDSIDLIKKSVDFSKNENSELSKIFNSSRESNSNQVKKKVAKYFAEQADIALAITKEE